ncbi:MAG: GPR endopeptidase [Clostridia bacterium]|nr:GPR endopeptidase [Clostridia bacterium]
MDKNIFDNYINSDLALEGGRIAPCDFRHAKYGRREADGVTVERLSVTDREGEVESGRPCGEYVTISSEAIKDTSCDGSAVAATVRDEFLSLFRTLTGREPDAASSVLVAGLGNRFMTPDALGARCADKIVATRHACDADSSHGIPSVSVVEPGVLSQTGIESLTMIKGVLCDVSPDVIVVIDSMAAKKTSRLATTIQLASCGIAPGHGIGNRRPVIDRASTGHPVISVGSPTVVGSSTLICDALEEAGIFTVTPELEAILEGGRDFFVTLNDSDEVIERISDIISCAVNSALGTSYLR